MTRWYDAKNFRECSVGQNDVTGTGEEIGLGLGMK